MARGEGAELEGVGRTLSHRSYHMKLLKIALSLNAVLLSIATLVLPAAALISRSACSGDP